MNRVWRYGDGTSHGWYLDDGDIVLDDADRDSWPGTFMALLRLRGITVSDLEFVSGDERAEFLADVAYA
jgi:hypothetical protein